MKWRQTKKKQTTKRVLRHKSWWRTVRFFKAIGLDIFRVRPRTVKAEDIIVQPLADPAGLVYNLRARYGLGCLDFDGDVC